MSKESPQFRGETGILPEELQKSVRKTESEKEKDGKFLETMRSEEEKEIKGVLTTLQKKFGEIPKSAKMVLGALIAAGALFYATEARADSYWGPQGPPGQKSYSPKMPSIPPGARITPETYERYHQIMEYKRYELRKEFQRKIKSLEEKYKAKQMDELTKVWKEMPKEKWSEERGRIEERLDQEKQEEIRQIKKDYIGNLWIIQEEHRDLHGGDTPQIIIEFHNTIIVPPRR